MRLRVSGLRVNHVPQALNDAQELAPSRLLLDELRMIGNRMGRGDGLREVNKVTGLDVPFQSSLVQADEVNGRSGVQQPPHRGKDHGMARGMKIRRL